MTTIKITNVDESVDMVISFHEYVLKDGYNKSYIISINDKIINVKRDIKDILDIIKALINE